jgi:hypothetical protein
LLADLAKRAQIAPQGMYKNTLDILKQTVRKEGVLALYKGEEIPGSTLTEQEWSVDQHGLCEMLKSRHHR